MKILGIETSCDETAASVVEDGRRLLSNVVASSLDLHATYGGVVPEIAARSHLEVIDPVIDQALTEAKLGWDDIDAIAVTQGPGLSGSLLIGVLAARTLAIAKQKPLYAVNHLRAHVFSTFITETALPGYSLPAHQPKFPLLALIASGGHTQIVHMKSSSDYEILGQTADDAVGEAFDKVAQILGLPYPGGPSIAKEAENGDKAAFHFPVAKMSGYNFSFSGPKTAVLRTAQKAVGKDFSFPSRQLPELLSKEQIDDIAASFQTSVNHTLASSLKKACDEFQPASVVIAGGVAANQHLRQTLEQTLSIKPVFTDIKLCTDNGAMVAAAAYFQSEASEETADSYQLAIEPGLIR